MKYSIQFNRFIFGKVLPDIKRLEGSIIVHDKFEFRPSMISKESLRALLKMLDLDYPKDENNKPYSYTDLTSKQMCDHIKWIELICAESGHCLDYIEEEWKRLMNNCKGI